MKKVFFEFLKKNKCLKAFKNNLSPRHNADEYPGGLNPKHYVLSAFVWDGTEQGHDYWSKLNYKWERIVESARGAYPKTAIEDFTFRTVGHGHCMVTYTSPTTGKSWSRTIDDMPLIDATKNAVEPKRKDLNILKRKCKGL